MTAIIKLSCHKYTVNSFISCWVLNIDEFEDKNRPCILVYIFWLNAKIIEKIQYPQTYNVFLNPKTLIATYEKK